MEASNRPEDLKKHFYLDCGFATRALHAGEHVGQPHFTNHTNAIFQTSTFTFETAKDGADLFAARKEGFVYTRMGNPTVLVLEAKLAALEGCAYKLAHPEKTVSCIAFSSGMAAISSTMMAILRPGDTLIAGEVLYGATEDFFRTVLQPLGIRWVPVETSNLELLEAALRQHDRVRAVYFETPTNPLMGITDIQALSTLVRSIRPDCHIVVDNTFATPFLQRPLELGADVVLHSTTKYIGGHGTVIGGAVIMVDEEVRTHLYHMMKDFGGCPSPFDAWLVNAGLKTLPLRMREHCANAQRIAEFLEQHPKVDRVFYPGLPSFPQHDMAKKQMSGFGGILSFEIKGGYAAAEKVMNSVRLFTLAVSLGCVDSLIQHPASMTHAMIPRGERERIGISEGLVRLSVGAEDVNDLLGDLESALGNA
ncbi:MAG: PLP-dependent aspartate aminotransferase family protein [Acidobacteriota bacterium]